MLRRSFIVAAAAITAAGATAVLSFAIPASAQPAVHYVALGDSYSSGLGAGSYDPASGSCDRSANAYPVLWAHAHAPASFTFVACAGATTSSVISGQLAALNSGTTLVSITVGGNDVGFTTVMETCVLFSTSDCVAAINTAEAQMKSTLPAALDRVLAAMAAAAPNARVVVLGYPELYDLANSPFCIGLSSTDRTDLNQAADQLDGQIQAAAQRHADAFADVRAAFGGHEICDPQRWLHSVDWLNLGDSYHPTAAGQAGAYFPVFSTHA
jgi:lysophospholipase L1-like esterase